MSDTDPIATPERGLLVRRLVTQFNVGDRVIVRNDNAECLDDCTPAGIGLANHYGHVCGYGYDRWPQVDIIGHTNGPPIHTGKYVFQPQEIEHAD